MGEKGYIERGALLKQIREFYGCSAECDENCPVTGCYERRIIMAAPVADVVEVVHGEWIKHSPGPDVMRKFHAMGIGKSMGERSIFWTCSNCNLWGMPHYKYCPHCGAKMDGGVSHADA